MIRQVQANGINGVPFVIIDGKWAVSGGQSAEVYIQVRLAKHGTAFWLM
jgi:predicted DsbA family dithiol-disulfide isomerase